MNLISGSIPKRRRLCDISIKTHITRAMMKQIGAAGTPLARYLERFAMYDPGADIMWDELAAAAWIDPTIITKTEKRYMAVNLSRGAGYGNTLTWSAEDKSYPAAQLVEIQDDLNLDKFYAMFVALMTAPTPSH
jgi:purine nucleosidase